MREHGGHLRRHHLIPRGSRLTGCFPFVCVGFEYQRFRTKLATRKLRRVKAYRSRSEQKHWKLTQNRSARVSGSNPLQLTVLGCGNQSEIDGSFRS